MTFFPKRKRKNDDRPRFPAWIIVVFAIGLVIVAVLIFSQPVGSITNSVAHNFPSDLMTSTPCIRLNTPQLSVTASNSNLDPLELTATAIVGIATSEAQGTSQPCVTPSVGELDPYALTATYIVQQVTSIAQGTPQFGTVPSTGTLDPLEMTATFLIGEATTAAQEASRPAQLGTLDPLEMTATYVVGQITSIAQGTPQAGS